MISKTMSRQKRSYPKRLNISTTYKLFFFLTMFICVYGYPIFYFLGGINAPTFFKLYNRLLKHKTFSGRKCQNKFTYLNTIQKKSLQQTEFFIVILSSSVALCTFSFSKSIRLKFRGLFFKRLLEEIQHCSFALKLAHQHKTRTSK